MTSASTGYASIPFIAASILLGERLHQHFQIIHLFFQGTYYVGFGL